ncbi:MAG: hypothetical protein ACU88J_15950, partial [Gammaproteobacteria bacterium]
RWRAQANDLGNRSCVALPPASMQSYDNLKTVVDTVFVGKKRKLNRRFMALANHYLFEPVACTPAAGWEKGQVENQVGNIREWLFTPRAKFETLAELNAWLALRCEELAHRKHPTQPTQTIADCFAQEQPLLRKVMQPFAGYSEQFVKVSKLFLVRWDRNGYSVPAVGWQSRVYQSHGASDPCRGKRSNDCRASALFLLRSAELQSLTLSFSPGQEAGVVNGSLIQNEMRRLTEPSRPKELNAGHRLQLETEPQADFQRYDHLLGGRHVH